MCPSRYSLSNVGCIMLTTLSVNLPKTIMTPSLHTALPSITIITHCVHTIVAVTLVTITPLSLTVLSPSHRCYHHTIATFKPLSPSHHCHHRTLVTIAPLSLSNHCHHHTIVTNICHHLSTPHPFLSAHSQAPLPNDANQQFDCSQTRRPEASIVCH